MNAPAQSPTVTVAPAVVRGTVVADDLVAFGGRNAGSFRTPDPAALVTRLVMRDPGALRDVHELAFDEIVGYLAELGERLILADNPHLQEAMGCSEHWSDMTLPLIRASFEQLPAMFAADAVREIADASIGVPYLDGWVERRMADGRSVAIRAMGARTVHVIAGNSPLIAALSIIRNAVTRSDAVIKTPSNDPLTAVAIARTMVEMAPDHPLTRHVSVAYWKGGDSSVEQRLYDPRYVEKIIAWGGFASVTHVVRYLRPGLELIALDPKRSATIIGPEAFASDATLREVARRTALDVGALNQLGCVNARVVYVASGLDDDGVTRANAFGQLVYNAMQRLPESVSTKAKRFDPELAAQLDGLRAGTDWYRVVGGTHGEGAVVVSQLDEPVDFHRSLSGRVANIVPLDDPMDVVRRVDASTQTLGVYPESLKRALRDQVALHGAQRLVSLGQATRPHFALPQDAMEPMRRMVKWIVDESSDDGDASP